MNLCTTGTEKNQVLLGLNRWIGLDQAILFSIYTLRLGLIDLIDFLNSEICKSLATGSVSRQNSRPEAVSAVSPVSEQGRWLPGQNVHQTSGEIVS